MYEHWLATTQLTTVNEYRRRFIETVAPLDRIFESILIGQFINGLKEEIKVEVRMFNPINLEQSMELALRVEEKHKVANPRKQILSSIKTSSGMGLNRGSVLGSTDFAGSQTSPSSIKSWGAASTISHASVMSP